MTFFNFFEFYGRIVKRFKVFSLLVFFLFDLAPTRVLAAQFCDKKEMASLDVDGKESGLKGDLGPYLQNVGSHSALIEWNYAQPKSAEFEFFEGLKKIVMSTPVATHQVVGVCQLKANEVYTYLIDRGPPNLFRTLPDSENSSFRFAAVGDSGTRGDAQKAVFQQIAAFKPLFIVMTGDLAYPNGSYGDYQETFLKPLQDLLAAVPVFPSLGNHDRGRGKAYQDIFSLPHNNDENSERYYSFNAGPVHFAVLDSSWPEPLEDPKSSQLKWLDSDLGGAKQPWKIVVFHHPPYASGIFHAEDRGVRWAVEPLLVKHGVDLVLNGHHHSYQRSYPQKGVVYIVTGGGGGKLRSIYYQKAYTEKAARRYHFVGFEVSKNKISLTAIDLNGAVIDTWEKSK